MKMNVSSRRVFTLAALLVAGGLAFALRAKDVPPACAPASAPAAGHADPHDAPKVSADSALKRLVEGNHRYVSAKAERPNQTSDRRAEVAKGQHPFAIVLACADSRVSPEVVFDQGLGDLFVVRLAGNVISDEVIASIEYAVAHLGSTLVVVLGHQRCGAVKAAVDTKPDDVAEGHLGSLIKKIQPAVAQVKGLPGDLLDNAIRANAELVTQQLRGTAPILSKMVAEKKIEIVAGRYDLDSGKVDFLGAAAAKVAPAEKMDSNGALIRLLKGNVRYRLGKMEHSRQTPDRRAELAAGQKPFAVVLACADSRVSPEILFDQGLGDLFVVRVAGNVLDKHALASIEYAVDHLGAQLVMVIGHQRCGAVKATVDVVSKGDHPHGNIAYLVDAIRPAVTRAKGLPGDLLDNAIKVNALLMVDEIKRSPGALADAVKENKVLVIGARYDLGTGEVQILP